MSVRIMSMVFERYPGQGGELVLALALADHAHDDGSHVFPSVPDLAAKTRQSERTVQRQLRAMEASGWLVCEQRSSGGRNRVSRYRIAPGWVQDPADFVFGKAGSEAIAPAGNGDILSPLGGQKPRQNVTVSDASSPPETVTSAARNGDTAVSPAKNHQEPSTPPVSPPKRKQADATDAPDFDLDSLARWMLDRLRALNPQHREPNWRRWRRDLRLLRDRDGRSVAEIRGMFAWANADAFWQGNILSPGKLRERWDQLVLQSRRTVRAAAGAGAVPSPAVPTPVGDTRCARTQPQRGRCANAGTRLLRGAWYCRGCAQVIEDLIDREPSARYGQDSGVIHDGV